MNEKVTTSELADLLAKRNGMTTEEAQVFIRKIFSLVVTVLKEEKYLKIKELGTFKLISVSSRESVAVNTGERIVIEGYDKISFTPENSLRDLINKPFAHFETISLNDGIEFEVDTEESEEEEPEEELPTPAAPVKKAGRPVSKTASRKKISSSDDEEELPPLPEPVAPVSSPVAGSHKKDPAPKKAPEVSQTNTVQEEGVAPSKKKTGGVNKTVSPVSTRLPQEEPTEPRVKKGTVRTRPRLIRPEEETPASDLDTPSAPRRTVRNEENPVITPRAESRKRKSILIQEAVSLPAVEETKIAEEVVKAVEVDAVEQEVKKSSRRLFGFRRKKKPTLLLPQEEIEDVVSTDYKEPVQEEEYMPEEAVIQHGEESTEAPSESEAPVLSVAEDRYPVHTKRNFAVPFYICLSLLIILVGTLAVSYFCYPQWLKDMLEEEGQSITIITVDAPSLLDAPPVEENERMPAELPQMTPQTAESVPSQPIEKQDLVAGERANPRDYKITGTLTTLTIQGGTSLARISKEYYGSRDLWPHVVEYNKEIITDPDNIPVGKTIKIPKLEKK